VNDPLRNTAAAHGADDTVLPPMISLGLSATTADAWLGARRTPANAVASIAAVKRRRMGGSFRGTTRGDRVGSAVRTMRVSPHGEGVMDVRRRNRPFDAKR
jgi:hypothetical protein